MNEREMLLGFIAQATTQEIMENPLFRVLVAMDATTANNELFSTTEEAKTMLPEHFEQAAIDGFNISINAVCDVVEKLHETISRELVMEALNQDMDELVKNIKDKLQ